MIRPKSHDGDRGLANEAIIFGVIADPEPQDSAIDIDSEGAMVKADPA
ncbi:MAG TPA: hypothetical protein VNT29_08115 [Candidatus Limnocylindrales bacterium]|nr:hypothetical protein [Candidatus Limnocylindrales bacterium]